MSRFSMDELKVWMEQGKLAVYEASILAQTSDDEPMLMKYWVYRKRIRQAPHSVQVNARERWVELVSQTGLRGQTMPEHVMANVCNALWDKLSDEERQAWLRSV